MDEPSLQERYAPDNICFGCGPSNPHGLRIRSFVDGGELVCRWEPAPHHQAFGGVLNGGICGTLLDCHSNWAAAHHLMTAAGDERLPCTVTADFHVRLRRPTPLSPLEVRARVVSAEGPAVVVDAEIVSGGKVTATCRGTFVAVEEGHPAYHRW